MEELSDLDKAQKLLSGICPECGYATKEHRLSICPPNDPYNQEYSLFYYTEYDAYICATDDSDTAEHTAEIDPWPYFAQLGLDFEYFDSDERDTTDDKKPGTVI